MTQKYCVLVTLVRYLYTQRASRRKLCVHVDEAVMGLSVHTDGDGAGDNPLLRSISRLALHT